ncbi:MAG: hypothetical protein ACR2P9_02715 [Gammaproteobacteria bacterium]
MDLLFNDLSIHGQFHDVKKFCEALDCVMEMRKIVKRNGPDDLYWHSSFATTRPVNEMPIQQVVYQGFTHDKNRGFMSWLSTSPYWDDPEIRWHSKDDWIEHDNHIVTDKAPAEAAIRQHHGSECGLVSLTPSDWKRTPLTMIWCNRGEGLDNETIDIKNWWKLETLESALHDLEPSPQSWQEMEERAKGRCDRLDFAENCFVALNSVPFSRSSAKKALGLFGILNKIANKYDDQGQRTAEGHKIHRDHFQGDKAWFSDSSDSEKARYANELTFNSPDGNLVLCSWHGKIKYPNNPLRFHFEWPGRRADGRIFVAYIGPKLTKQ